MLAIHFFSISLEIYSPVITIFTNLKIIYSISISKLSQSTFIFNILIVNCAEVWSRIIIDKFDIISSLATWGLYKTEGFTKTTRVRTCFSNYSICSYVFTWVRVWICRWGCLSSTVCSIIPTPTKLARVAAVSFGFISKAVDGLAGSRWLNIQTWCEYIISAYSASHICSTRVCVVISEITK